MDDQQKQKPNYSQKPKNQSPNFFHFFIIGMILTTLINLVFASVAGNNKVQIMYNQFIEMLEAGYVSQVEIGEQEINFRLENDISQEAVDEILGTPETEKIKSQLEAWKPPYSAESVYMTGRLEDPGLIEKLIDHDVDVYRPVKVSNPILDFVGSWILPFVLFYFIYFVFVRLITKKMGGSEGFGGMMNIGRSKAKIYDMEKSTGITFADVAGQEEAKESMAEIVDFLHNPDKYQKIGAKQPKGALLVGPPGTGKTLLAKAVAGEAGVPFYSLSGSEFVEMFVGVGASRVRDLFQQANKNAPCIIFIDEIDAIGKSRDNQIGGNDEREQTLNQLLAEMDGFDSSKGIIILAATNRPEILDKALLRPGRFDRRVIVEKPDLVGREAILTVHSEKVQMDTDVDLHQIALATSGAAGADLANMINEGALRAVRMDRNTVNQEDLMEAVEVVIAGKEKRDRILNKKEKRMVAYHEVGHALASALQKDAQPVQKITIVPRTMGALGYTMNMPEEERYLMTKSEILAQIVTLLAGRAAEEVQFGEATTGASNDIERAAALARSMVTQYGMSEKFDMMGLESTQNQYLDGRRQFHGADATGAEVDKEIRDIIQTCHQQAIQLLEQRKESLVQISEFLIEKETITGKQFMEILTGGAIEQNG